MFRALIVLIFLTSTPALAQTLTGPPADHIDAALEAVNAATREGRFADAEQLARAGVALATETDGENGRQTLLLRQRLAQIIEDQGRLDEAFPIFRDVYERWLANYTPYAPGKLSAQMAYAQALSSMGRTEEALPLAVEALRYGELGYGKAAELTVIWRANVAFMFQKLGYWDEALATFIDSVEAFRTLPGERNQRQRAIAAQNTAHLLDRMGRETEAGAYWAEAIGIYQTVYPATHPTAVIGQILFIDHLNATRQFDRITALLPIVRPLTLETFGAQSAPMFAVREWEAMMQAILAKGDVSQIIDAANKMESVATDIGTLMGARSDRAGRAWLNLAAMRGDTPDKASALRAALNAEAAGFGSRDTLYTALIEARRAGQISHDDMMSDVVRISQISYQSSFKTAARMQGLRLELGEGAVQAAYRRVTDLQAQEQEMQGELLYLTGLPANERDSAREDHLRKSLTDAGVELKDLIDLVTDQAPEAAAMMGDAVISHDEIRALLGPDEALIILDLPADDRDQAMIIAVSKDRSDWWPAGANNENFGYAAADIRASIDLRLGVRAAAALDDDQAQPAQQPFNYYAAEFLYENSFGLAKDILEGKTHIYVDLRGPFSGLPPQLLVKPGPADAPVHWMARDHAITVIPSAFALKISSLVQESTRTRAPLIGFADPDFGIAPGTTQVAALAAGQGALRGALAPLPETRDELRAVAQALGSGTLFEGRAATEHAVKSANLSEYSVLYFATHGLVAGDLVRDGELAEPALALTAADDDDGLLTQTEIAGLTLDADLVVLSACNTAVGGAPGAEALSGLAQAFAYAGARSLMVSHWPVESQSAVAMMTDIFARRAADPNLSLARAQQQAILKLIDNPARDAWSHPSYWAPFVLVGSAN